RVRTVIRGPWPAPEVGRLAYRRQPAGRRGRRAGDVREGLPRDPRVPRRIGARHLALPHPHQRLLRRSAEAEAGGRSGGARPRNARGAVGPDRAQGGASHGPASYSSETPDGVSAVRGGRVETLRNRRDPGDPRRDLEGVAVRGQEGIETDAYGDAPMIFQCSD